MSYKVTPQSDGGDYPRAWGWGILFVGLVGVVGCNRIDPTKGYTSREMYREDVKTVCVEMFDSQGFRRGIEFELTRAICQRLELHTPYKIVASREEADTVLYGKIKSVSETGLIQQQQLDRPIEKRLVMLAMVNWKDLRSGDLLLEDREVIADGYYAVLLAAGTESAVREAANEMAIRVVEAMESPW